MTKMTCDCFRSKFGQKRHRLCREEDERHTRTHRLCTEWVDHVAQLVW